MCIRDSYNTARKTITKTKKVRGVTHNVIRWVMGFMGGMTCMRWVGVVLLMKGRETWLTQGHGWYCHNTRGVEKGQASDWGQYVVHEVARYWWRNALLQELTATRMFGPLEVWSVSGYCEMVRWLVLRGNRTRRIKWTAEMWFKLTLT